MIDDRGDEHVATIAGGAWTADVDASEPLVRFADAAGELVAQPLPEGARTPVRDAPEACPVCAAVAWVRIGGAVLCERCGHVAGIVHEVEGGVQMRIGGVVDDVEDSVGIALTVTEFDADDAEDFKFDAEEYLREQAEALSALPFPVYAAPGLAESAAGRYDGTGEVFVHHDRPATTTARSSWSPPSHAASRASRSRG